jgi:trehalose 6-phosphate synthase/phosphatase
LNLRSPNLSSRLIVVSNRLPVTVEEVGGNVDFLPSSGGLATGLNSIREKISSWVGWPGQVSQNQEKFVSEYLEAKHGCVPVFLSERLVEKYYEGYSNRTIWPLFHSFQSFAQYSSEEWAAYVEANQRFLQTLDGILQAGDQVWIHDYQLLLLPGLLRQRFPSIKIGFFLHIPFPPFDVLRLMPQHREILQSLLAADLVGFHTNDYARSFLNGVHRSLGIEDRMGQLLVGERVVHSIVHPMGISFEKFSSASSSLAGNSDEFNLQQTFDGSKVIFSVARLDYTKGVPQALESFELLLERRPDLCGQVAMVLAVVPSRENVDRYSDLKREIDEAVGRINAKFGEVNWTPIRYLYRTLSFDELVLFYKNSHVALVTPLRDGMNLVAKEYVAARNDETGVLVLSEMAGAAKELLEAILVNPNSREEMADALEAALFMSPTEQVSRMRALRERLLESPIQNWGEDFVSKLEQVSFDGKKLAREAIDDSKIKEIAHQANLAARRLFLLDYDGTLMPIMNNPKQVIPDRALKDLLMGLNLRAEDHVMILSGRSKSDLETWLSDTGVSLVAEHGAWAKLNGAKSWRCFSSDISVVWKKDVHEVLGKFVEKIPGSYVEEKEFSLVWHFRRSEPESADTAAKDLIFHLLSAIGEHLIRIVPGNRSIEIRCIGVGKGSFAKREIDFSKFDFVLVAGDDLTDEDVFNVAPDKAISIKVGPGFSKAKFRAKDHLELRKLLSSLVEPAAKVEALL